MKKSIYFIIVMIFPVVLSAQWQEIYSTTDVFLLNNIKFFDEQTGVLLANDGFIKMTQDGGQSWEQIIYPNQTASMADFFVFGNNNYLALANNWGNSSFMVSTNSGASWNEVSPNIFFPQAVDYFNSNLGFCAAFDIESSITGQAIYKLGGIGPDQSAEQVYFTELEGYFDHIFCLNDEVVLASFEISDNNPPFPQYTGTLLRSDDQGSTWAQVLQLSDNKMFQKIGLSLDGTCLYAHTWDEVFYSMDEGLTWETQPISLVTVDLLSRQEAYGVVITSGFGTMIDTLNLAFTADAWQSWTAQLKIPFDPFYIDRSLHLQMLSANTGFYSYYNQLFKTTNGGWVGIDEQPAGNLAELVVTPNPAKESFWVGRPGTGIEATIKVFDSRGSVIFSKAIDHDRQSLQIDASTWRPGIYFISLEDVSGKQTKSKLVIL
ncbi:MAG TPA: T9SS type A sorting domain-containing protein [Bacteroidales bacterium]|nr:T9SS type A sorting domain-containing protein [Bacteroidales bacterium]